MVGDRLQTNLESEPSVCVKNGAKRGKSDDRLTKRHFREQPPIPFYDGVLY